MVCCGLRTIHHAASLAAQAVRAGQVGPNLDGTALSAAQIEAQVRQGGGGMPSFSGKLSEAQIKAVAGFVSGSR